MAEALASPVVHIATDNPAREPDKGIAICLSGGGYRAMLFHVGALWRIQELGFLNTEPTAPRFRDLGSLERVSSVSGGSITSAMLALKWSACQTNHPDAATRYAAFEKQVVIPIRAFSKVNIAGRNAAGVLGVLGAIVLPGSINDYVTRKYRDHLYGDTKLDQLPARPFFVINASNLQSGALWRFTRAFMRDWRVGEIKNTSLVTVARAVAASSAFPPPLSPAVLQFKESDYTPNSGGTGTNNLQKAPYTTKVVLSDGGVYDNLGLETAYKHYQTILVSDAGKPFQFENKPGRDWLSQALRVANVMDNQVGNLRIRQLIESFKAGRINAPASRKGCYWGIDTDISGFPALNKLPCPIDRVAQLAGVDTDLAKKDDTIQERLINWGYAVADASIRSYVDNTLSAPTRFPYAREI